MVSGRIAVVLPSRETFARQRSGAVALCARDFARFSRFASRIDILGAGDCDFSDVSYRRLRGWKQWWRRDRDAYAAAVCEASRDCALIEAQNRPLLARALRGARAEARIVLHLHNDPQTMAGSRSPTERAELLALCDAIYCVSDFIRARLLEGIVDADGKAVTILNGVAFSPLPTEKANIVAFTGRVAPIKGVAELVRAFAAADLSDWRLLVVGADPDGLLRTLRDECAALGDRFEWRGQVGHDEAMALLASAEIAAVPSMWEEPCGRAAVEALAQGCALVTSRRGGLPEVAGDAALYVEPADTAGFSAALRRLARDAALRRELQARARQRADLLDIRPATARIDAMRARLLGEPCPL